MVSKKKYNKIINTIKDENVETRELIRNDLFTTKMDLFIKLETMDKENHKHNKIVLKYKVVLYFLFMSILLFLGIINLDNVIVYMTNILNPF